mmetsp:Transcript_13605/g.29130  ORF Transcript_13605/g.29130 Transcript_13605/m.29130 type:complete len:548 (+) Transcript_13605:262-1905(+)
MGDNYWELTVAILQDNNAPIISKPKLSEKYLTKPPFRFLHDIVTAIQKGTGFAPGLFQGAELDSQAIQDKEAKVAYLSKIINTVSIFLGEPCPAKALKIVAGLEPENTNIFLQMLGKACRMGDAADVVQRVLAGEVFSGGRPSSRPSSQQRNEPERGVSPPPAAAPAPAKVKRSDSGERRSKAPPAEEAPAPAAPPPEKPSSKERSSRSKASAPPPAEEEPPAPPPPEKKERGSSSGSKSKSSKSAAPPPPPKEEEPEMPPNRSASPSNDAAMRASLNSTGQRSMNRPQSARKAPPKLPVPAPAPSPSMGAPATPVGARPGTASRRPTSNQEERPGSGPMPGAGGRNITLFEEGAKGGDSDDDVEVVHEQAPVAVGPGRDLGGEQGVLVKNILEAEKNLKKNKDEGGGGEEEAGGTGIILKRVGKAPGGGAGPVLKAGDLNGIRELVQRLCQSSHPLAKSMDYLAEDLENMAKEYRFWTMERRVFQDKLADEQRMAVDPSTSSEAQLADLDSQIKQVRDRIVGLKAQVLRNDDTVAKLLGMAVAGSR